MYKEGNDFVNNTDKYKRDFARVLTLLMLLAALFVTDIPVSADTTDSATVSSISAVTEKAEIKASSNTALKISWEKCPLAQGYVIYRRESTRKAFRRIKKVSASRTSYIDKRLTSSKPYQYAVRAIRKENGARLRMEGINMANTVELLFLERILMLLDNVFEIVVNRTARNDTRLRAPPIVSSYR